MATQQEYSAVANALVAAANAKIATLPQFEQDMILQYLTPDKLDAIAGAGAKTAVDTLDAYRAAHPPTT